MRIARSTNFSSASRPDSHAVDAGGKSSTRLSTIRFLAFILLNRIKTQNSEIGNTTLGVVSFTERLAAQKTPALPKRGVCSACRFGRGGNQLDAPDSHRPAGRHTYPLRSVARLAAPNGFLSASNSPEKTGPPNIG